MTHEFRGSQHKFWIEEIADVDLSAELGDETQLRLTSALTAHRVLVFRDQQLDPKQQARVASCFGPLRRAWQRPHHPCDHEYVHYIANVDLDGRLINEHPDPYSRCWHSDGSWAKTPAKATVLHAAQLPTSGSTTIFTDMHALFRQLPDARRDQIREWRAVHDVDLSRAGRNGRWPWQWRPGRDASLAANTRWMLGVLKRSALGQLTTHPIVRLHPESGEPLLFVGDHAWRITGMPWPLGVREMQKLNDFEPPPESTYTHEWREGDVLIWDNRAVLHRVGDYENLTEPRVMQRCVVESPFSVL